MYVNIDDKVYEMDKKKFKSICKVIEEKKTGSYSIYGLVSKNLAMLVDENFKNKNELLKKLAIYSQKKLKCLYTTGES